MLIILSVITAASRMQAVGGIDYLVEVAKRTLKRNPAYIALVISPRSMRSLCGQNTAFTSEAKRSTFIFLAGIAVIVLLGKALAARVSTSATIRDVLKDAVFERPDDGVLPPRHAEFGVNRSRVCLHRVDGDIQFVGDLAGRQHRRKVAENLQFPLTELVPPDAGPFEALGNRRPLGIRRRPDLSQRSKSEGT
jgi:Anaerobic c4-dicarboxylate membrane transporter